jgi:radical SAM-linked protein
VTLPTAEPKQRWRLTYARPAPSTPTDVGREYATAWEAALVSSGLPLVPADGGRPRISFAAPLPTGIAGRAELLDIWLADRLPAWRVREALEPVLPEGHELIDLENVWLGASPLPGQINGAVYRITPATANPAEIERAVARLVGASRLERERQKGGTVRTYDLRPLIADLKVVPADASGPLTLRLTTRIHPELGSGRPDEVLAALAEVLGAPLDVAEIVRERLLRAGE